MRLSAQSGTHLGWQQFYGHTIRGHDDWLRTWQQELGKVVGLVFEEEVKHFSMSRTQAEEIALARSMMMRRVTSIVEDQGAYSSSCGYCKSSLTSVAQGLWAHTLTVDDYQELLNRRWRRSGMFLYKPKMRRTCCPPHSIRVDVNAFVISKEQSRVIRRMQRYLEGSYHVTRLSDNWNPSSGYASGAPAKDLVGAVATPREKKRFPSELGPLCSAKKKKTSEMEDEAAVQLSASIEGAIIKCVEFESLPQDLVFPQISVRKVTEYSRQIKRD